jgi:putative thiamine transport system substrate-binding protein
MMSRWTIAAAIAMILLIGLASAVPSTAADERPSADWQAVLDEARGQTVYWYAWGGEQRINAYIAWVAGEADRRFAITLNHVKVADTADAVARVLAEKTAGRHQGGAVDLVWINGANFVAMKENALLLDEPWADELPNAPLVGVDGSRAPLATDFGVPTEGREAPWGRAQLVFLHDSAILPAPPKSLDGLAAFLAENPGRFTYPQPPDFLGVTFLKQIARTLLPADVLAAPAGPDAADVVAPVFEYLDRTTSDMWRSGRAYPANVAALRTLLADGEIDIAMSFNPADASAAVAAGQLPPTTRTFILDGGTIGNTHYVAIPYNSDAAAAAKVVANFLTSPEAQARKADPKVWGDPTVLDIPRLPAADRALFEQLRFGPERLAPHELSPTLVEPHYSWTKVLETEWAQRALTR